MNFESKYLFFLEFSIFPHFIFLFPPFFLFHHLFLTNYSEKLYQINITRTCSYIYIYSLDYLNFPSRIFSSLSTYINPAEQQFLEF